MNEDYYKKIFSNNLKYYMSVNNKSQIDIINDLGINKSAISTWCNGTRLPRMDKVDALAKYLHCKRSDLIEERDTTTPRKTQGVSINVYGSVAAGVPIEAIEDIVDTEEIALELARTGTFFGLRIKGDSMEPKMSTGDVVIVRRQDDADSGDVVIATVNGDEATCKRLRKYTHGIDLLSTNPNYEPLYFSNKDIEEKPVRIIGKVVELRAKF